VAVVATFLEALDVTAGVVAEPAIVAGWGSPSALEGYTVGGLLAHLRHAIGLTLLAFDTPPAAVAGGAVQTLADLYGPARLDDRVDLTSATPARLVAAGNGEAADAGAERTVAAFASLAADLRTRLAHDASIVPSALVTVPWGDGGTTTAEDFLTTRLLELVVHGDDLAVSVGLPPPEPSPTVLAAVTTALVELAVARAGGLEVVRAFTRTERTSDPGALRVL
jgi:hypothetical protein